MNFIKTIAIIFIIAFPSVSSATFLLDPQTGLFTPDNPSYYGCAFYTRVDNGPLFTFSSTDPIYNPPQTIQTIELSYNHSFQDIVLIELDPQVVPDCLSFNRSTIEPQAVSSVTINYGCTQSQFTNYNPTATIDDGSCLETSTTTINVPDYTESFNNLILILLVFLAGSTILFSMRITEKSV